ncbi:MAG: hypothetical protein OXM87_12090 [Truepera sp.]|nr:hypothetical protein [Truepera sp.]
MVREGARQQRIRLLSGRVTADPLQATSEGLGGSPVKQAPGHNPVSSGLGSRPLAPIVLLLLQ